MANSNRLSADLERMFREAIALQQQGRLRESEKIYARVLKAAPNHFDALNLLGTVKAQQGRIGEAQRLFSAAVKVNPNVAGAWANLGQALHAVRLPPAERDAQKREEALRVLVAPFRVLDAAVAEQPYLLGSDFTVADLNVAAVISRAVDMDLSAVPNLKAWLVRGLDRPAARAALALKAQADAETPVEVTRRIARINRL